MGKRRRSGQSEGLYVYQLQKEMVRLVNIWDGDTFWSAPSIIKNSALQHRRAGRYGHLFLKPHFTLYTSSKSQLWPGTLISVVQQRGRGDRKYLDKVRTVTVVRRVKSNWLHFIDRERWGRALERVGHVDQPQVVPTDPDCIKNLRQR